MSKSVCLFAHFSPKGSISAYVYTYLDALSDLNFDIVFISNSAVLEQDQIRLQKNPRISIKERENKGNDFGAWQWAVQNNLIPADTDQLLLTNDSNFGPITDLREIMDVMSAKPGLDFWGLTESYQGGQHLQSFFVLLSRKAFLSEAFKRVFSQDFNNFPKKSIIERGEIFLTTELAREGLTWEAFVPYPELDPDMDPLFLHNPTHYYYHQLITRYKYPFVKKELVLQNPENLQGLPQLLEYIDLKTNYPVNDILDALVDVYDRGTTPVNKSPHISAICHLYYPSSIYYFLSKLAALKNYPCTFIFNLSTTLFHDKYFLRVLKQAFPGSIILSSPSVGRDIGGKLLAINALIKLGINSDYTLIVHDKLSPHTPTGKDWRDKLFRVFEEKGLPKLFQTFEQDTATGVIVSKEFVKNEYDPDNASFNCTSKENLLHYIKAFNMHLTNYNFAAGTIFWIKTGILTKFFTANAPLDIREGLERGNALDFTSGTNIHAWERVFSLMANAEGYKITGI